MKKIVKAISVLLAIGLLALSFCSCKGKTTDYSDDDSKQANLIVAFPFSATADLDKVQDKINEELKSLLPNTTIELICDSSMTDKWSLWMSGKKVIDITHSGYAMELLNEIRKSSFIPLNDMIEKYAPTIKDEIDAYNDLYQTGTYNGNIYGIPCIQYFVNDFIEMRYHTNLSQYFDPATIVSLTHNNVHTTEDIYEYLDGVFAKIKAEKGKFYIGAARMKNPALASRGYVMIGNTNFCYDAYTDKVEIIDFHETDEYKTYIKYMNKWYNDGYIPKDILSGVSSEENFFISNGSLYGVDDNYKKDDATGWTMVTLEDPDKKIMASYNVGDIKSYMSIPSTSTNPVRAMKFLELIRTEKGAVIANLMAYGIEGEHYEKISDTEIKAFDYSGQGTASSKYSIPQWMIGNNFNMLIVNPYTQELYDWAKDYYENYKPSLERHKLYGLCFDFSKVNVKVSNIKSVNEEYETQLAYGAVNDVNSVYNTMLERTKSAGLEDIIKELQSQADEYIAKSK